VVRKRRKKGSELLQIRRHPLTPPIAQLLALQAVDQYIRHKEQDLHTLKSQMVNITEQQAVTAQEIQTRQLALMKWKETGRQREEELVQVEVRSSEKHLCLQQSGSEEESLALQQEIEGLEQSKMQLQEEISTLREQVEKEREELRRAKDEATTLQVRVMAEIDRLQVQSVSLREEIQQKQRERERLAAGIDTSTLREYERIFAWREDVAVVELHAQTCQGCHMRLPLQVCYEIQANHRLSFCPYCHRLLYWLPPEPSATGPTPAALGTLMRPKKRTARKAGKRAQAKKGSGKDLPESQQVRL
jgi:predicted  nucleic acid-binding Zn-ribbon protein